MREYSKVSPRFWTGDTGRRIRALGDDALVVAMYLLTAPASNMTGLYYLALPTLAHETGRSLEGACKALASLSEIGFAHYDQEHETVYLPEMARHQIGRSIKPNDNQRTGVLNQLAEHSTCSFVLDFWQKYAEAYALTESCPYRGDKPLTRPLVAPYKALGGPSILRSRIRIRIRSRRESRSAPPPPPPVDPIKQEGDPGRVEVPERPDARGGESPPRTAPFCGTVEHLGGPVGDEIADTMCRASSGKISGQGTAADMADLGRIARAVRPKSLTLDDFGLIGEATAAGAALAYHKGKTIPLGYLVKDDGAHLLDALAKARDWAKELHGNG